MGPHTKASKQDAKMFTSARNHSIEEFKKISLEATRRHSRAVVMTRMPLIVESIVAVCCSSERSLGLTISHFDHLKGRFLRGVAMKLYFSRNSCSFPKTK